MVRFIEKAGYTVEKAIGEAEGNLGKVFYVKYGGEKLLILRDEGNSKYTIMEMHNKHAGGDTNYNNVGEQKVLEELGKLKNL